MFLNYNCTNNLKLSHKKYRNASSFYYKATKNNKIENRNLRFLLINTLPSSPKNVRKLQNNVPH